MPKGGSGPTPEERLAVLEIRLETVEETQQEWKNLFKGAVTSTAKWILTMATAGLLFGWHLPEDMRKRMANLLEWLSK